MPFRDSIVDWKQHAKATANSNVITKTVTRTVKMANGTQRELGPVIENLYL